MRLLIELMVFLVIAAIAISAGALIIWIIGLPFQLTQSRAIAFSAIAFIFVFPGAVNIWIMMRGPEGEGAGERVCAGTRGFGMLLCAVAVALPFVIANVNLYYCAILFIIGNILWWGSVPIEERLMSKRLEQRKLIQPEDIQGATVDTDRPSRKMDRIRITKADWEQPGIPKGLDRIALEYWASVGSKGDLEAWAVNELGKERPHPDACELFNLSDVEAGQHAIRLAEEILNFKPESEKGEEWAKVLLVLHGYRLVDEDIKPDDFCSLVRLFDGSFQGCPEWLGDLWNCCDWCDDTWSLSDSPHLVNEVKRVIASLDPNGQFKP